MPNQDGGVVEVKKLTDQAAVREVSLLHNRTR